jgi:hypothetical protein
VEETRQGADSGRERAGLDDLDAIQNALLCVSAELIAAFCLVACNYGSHTECAMGRYKMLIWSVSGANQSGYANLQTISHVVGSHPMANEGGGNNLQKKRLPPAANRVLFCKKQPYP